MGLCVVDVNLHCTVLRSIVARKQLLYVAAIAAVLLSGGPQQHPIETLLSCVLGLRTPSP